ncbi:MATE family efflux transporter [Raoultibacter timonensis]|uniref:MATE family efflux transporter n=1 Tax=Raoultibacter timonensis TaxID=1907662 RepID=UPI000C85EAC3|nr:MATE family efflux transporter [Raoultibacter timonensis]
MGAENKGADAVASEGGSDSKAFLATESLGRLMARLAIPTVVAQLVNLLYGIVDRVFIGHIPGVGADALTGVGVCLPIVLLIASFSAFAGAGGAPLASIALGNGDAGRANRIMANVVTLLVIFAVCLIVVFALFGRSLLGLFGASEATLPYAWSYLSIYLVGTFFVMAYLGLCPFLLAQGDSKYALIAVATGAVLNIVLDPLLIFVCGMGIQGAAVASVVSQGVSAALTVAFLRRKSSVFRVEARLVRPEGEIVRPVLALGGAPFFMQATESLIIVVLNGTLQTYGGDLYVGALTILQSILQLLFAPANGFTQGVQPIVSYSYGARLFDRVKSAAKRLIAVSFAFEFVCAVAVMLFPAPIAQLFTEDAQLVELVGEVAPVFIAGMSLMGLQLGMQSIFMGLGQAKLSLAVATVRKIVLLIPLALVLPHFVGVWGVYFAEPLSDVLSVAFCSTLFLVNIRSILSERALEKVA